LALTERSIDLKEAIERQAAALVKAARLQLDGNFLRLP
jgi:hypothetical protein